MQCALNQKREVEPQVHKHRLERIEDENDLPALLVGKRCGQAWSLSRHAQPEHA
jgi:hypothetical protein